MPPPQPQPQPQPERQAEGPPPPFLGGERCGAAPAPYRTVPRDWWASSLLQGTHLVLNVAEATVPTCAESRLISSNTGHKVCRVLLGIK